MSKKKICMVGDFAVGKTSLTQKFVNNVFSDKYLTTIGVKIDTAEIGDTKVILWDIAGRDSLSPVNVSYLVGASGVVLVADGTRDSTVKNLYDIWQTIVNRVGEVPAVVAVNKNDSDDWSVDEQDLERFSELGWPVFFTSAKNDQNIGDVFQALVDEINSK